MCDICWLASAGPLGACNVLGGLGVVSVGSVEAEPPTSETYMHNYYTHFQNDTQKTHAVGESGHIISFMRAVLGSNAP